VEFLLKATGRTDHDGAARLAEALGFLPLALDHAAAFCFDGGISFDAYRAQLADWLDDAPDGAEYPQAVFATFSVAIEKAAAEEPMAEQLMGLLAFMAPDDFPRDIIPEEVIGSHALSKAVIALRKLSLIAVKEDAQGGTLLSVHRLVHHVTRVRLHRAGWVDCRNGRAETHQTGDGFCGAQPILQESPANEAARAALTIVADAFPNPADDVRNWPDCERLLPHAMTLLPNAPDSGDGAEKTSLLCNQLAIYVESRADYAASELLKRRALAIDEAAYGPDHPRVATHINNLAQLLKATNRLAEAEPLMRRALAIDEAAYGPDHPKVAIRLNNLAQLLHDTNRLVEAEPMMRRAVAIFEASLGPDHPKTRTVQRNLDALLAAMAGIDVTSCCPPIPRPGRP
jgi:tetratricopeptide (TPR) repeat protein